MTQYVRLDPHDIAAAVALDEGFTVSADGMTAAITGIMTFTIARAVADGVEQYKLKLELPSGEPFEMNTRREPLVNQFNFTGESTPSSDQMPISPKKDNGQ